MTISEDRQMGRAKNEVLAFLERKLSVPKIYLDAEWDGHRIDVLAINRDGVGEVYAVLMFARSYLSDGQLDLQRQNASVSALVSEFASIPAHFKYIAAVDTELRKAPNGTSWIALFRVEPQQLLEQFFSPDGVGRIGLLHVVLGSPDGSDDETFTEEGLKPERFRAKIATLAGDYIQQHEADWEIRA